MPRNRKTVGATGEMAAAAFLESRGYRIIDTNVRPLGGVRRGELDLVAWDKDTLVFIEVKTRRSAFGLQGAPVESIDKRKRRQLLFLAERYLARYSLDQINCRFDVIEIIESREGLARFHLIVNAFDATDA